MQFAARQRLQLRNGWLKNGLPSLNLNTLRQLQHHLIRKPVFPRRTLPTHSSHKPLNWKWIPRQVTCASCASSLPTMWANRSTRRSWRVRWKARSCRRRDTQCSKITRRKMDACSPINSALISFPPFGISLKKLKLCFWKYPIRTDPGVRAAWVSYLFSRLHPQSPLRSMMRHVYGSTSSRSRLSVFCAHWAKYRKGRDRLTGRENAAPTTNMFFPYRDETKELDEDTRSSAGGVFKSLTRASHFIRRAKSHMRCSQSFWSS